MKTNYSPKTKLELKEDIVTPDMYLRSGEIKTMAEWKKLYPRAFKLGLDNRWFRPVEIKTTHRDYLMEIIVKEFERRNLHSLSYQDACYACINIVLEKNELNKSKK